MATVKIYSLSHFKIHSRVWLTVVAMLYVTSPGLTYLETGGLYLLTRFSLRPPHPLPVGTPQSGVRVDASGV